MNLELGATAAATETPVLSEEELKQLRATTKGSVTRIYNFARDFKGLDIDQILQRNKKLEELYSKYDNIQSRLEILNVAEHESDRDMFETTYYNAKSLIGGIISKLTKSSANSTPTVQFKSIPVSNHSSNDNVKLPKINIPIFSGDYQNWKSFSDIFESLVHANNNLSKIQKFFYLKSQLRGEALQIIESITVTSDNYDEAWTLLNERFNNKQFIVNIHLQSLFEIPCITRDFSSSLRHLITEAKQHLRSLKSLGLPTDQWDDLIIYMLTQKLDSQCRRDWELSKPSNTQVLPNLNEFFTFLEKRCFSLEAIKPNKPSFNNNQYEKPKPRNSYSFVNSEQRQQNNNSNYTLICKLCKGPHTLTKCERFLNQTPNERTNTVKNLNICFNCLKDNHPVAQCRSTYNCRTCRKNHHSLLHFERQFTPRFLHTGGSSQVNSINHNNRQQLQPSTSTSFQQSQQSLTTQHLRDQSSQILLATAIILVRDCSGQWQTCRVLLDSGSQINFVSTSLIRRLSLRTMNHFVNIGGIAQVRTDVSQITRIHIASRVSAYHRELEFLVLDKITNQLPSTRFEYNNWNLPHAIQFADPYFNIPGDIDMLLGAEIFVHILRESKFRIPATELVLKDTEFGFIVSGRVQNCLTAINQNYSFIVTDTLENQMSKFWEVEENYKGQEKVLSIEESECERHFVNNTCRDNSGRFIVKLPFKTDPSSLGDSYSVAFRRFMALERKFNKNENLKIEYSSFLREYEELGHMKEVFVKDHNQSNYYLPHHAVLKENSLSTKLRVVFDASAETTSGVSLNNILMVGPTIQNDLFTILLRFRVHAYVFTADIEKMYRQVRVHDSETKYQRILWRSQPNERIKTYELQTVTYGQAAAPYLAIRCLNQLAEEEKIKYPRASRVVKSDFYVDDLITGKSSINSAIQLRDEIIALFICMSTKAIHIELVTGLSTEDFLAAFRRFVARRGKPANVYSDNGTNFRGASKEIREIQEFLSREDTQSTISNISSSEQIQWHFIPPNAPNFGGLWEAGIKSVKGHLKRVVGDTRLTFEEMYTLLTQIECCLNSRPLTPIFDDPTDLTVLTPGHFLIFAPLTQVPEHRLTDVKINKLSRWQLIQQMLQHFWDKWSREYLHQLQQRRKWNKSAENLSIGDMVILKDNQSSPLTWKPARLVQVHPGDDGTVRVVTVRTSAGSFRRAISSLAPLPISETSET